MRNEFEGNEMHSRIVLLESNVKNNSKEIDELKSKQSEFSKVLFGKIDGVTKEVHKMALSSQAMSITNHRWMIGLLIGFIAQTVVGVFLLVLNKGGL